MTSFASVVGIGNVWFVDPDGHSVRCINDCLDQRVVDMDDGLPCNNTSLKCEKYHKMNELVENVLEDMVSCNKR